MNKLFSAALASIALIAVTGGAEAKAYKCWNPAICIAVCGKPVCGEAFASQAQQRDAQSKPQTQIKAAPAKPQQR